MSDLRERIENRLGLEPLFSVLDDGGTEPWSEKDPDKRFAVYDAEMQVVCRCAKREHADLLCELLNRATG